MKTVVGDRDTNLQYCCQTHRLKNGIQRFLHKELKSICRVVIYLHSDSHCGTWSFNKIITRMQPELNLIVDHYLPTSANLSECDCSQSKEECNCLETCCLPPGNLCYRISILSSRKQLVTATICKNEKQRNPWFLLVARKSSSFFSPHKP